MAQAHCAAMLDHSAGLLKVCIWYASMHAWIPGANTFTRLRCFAAHHALCAVMTMRVVMLCES